MKFSNLFAPTLREDPAEAEIISHKLMLRAGFIRKLAGGIYNYLPLGWKVIQKVERIVREEMDRSGAQEVLLAQMLPAELWQETERWEIYGKELVRVKDRHERDFCMGPTHEEVITDLVRNNLNSYKKLPITLYQIQTKFRDEIRPRFGVMRSREFIMKDAYSFDKDEDGLKKTYQVMHDTYKRIFDRCGLKFRVVEADPGAIGGGFSQEFMVTAETGEDEILCCSKCDFAAKKEDIGLHSSDGDECPKCKIGTLFLERGIEVGHIFQLGTKYSKKMNAVYLNESDQEVPYVMGCYGIGISRIAAAAIEQNHDKDGIKWPIALAPYQVNIIPVNMADETQKNIAFNIYESMQNEKIEVIIDDREERGGVKFKDSDLIGFPVKVIIGKLAAEGKVEVKLRSTGETFIIPVAQVVDKILSF